MFKKFHLFSYIFLLVIFGSTSVNASNTKKSEFDTTITRDEYGVPLIQGGTLEDVSYAIGLAQAQDRLWQISILL